MSVTRKPSYDLALAAQPGDVVPDRPRHLHAHVVHRRRRAARRWPASLARWRTVSAGERLLRAVDRRSARSSCSLHDVGNERRFVFFIPALVALTAIVLGARSPAAAGGRRCSCRAWRALLAAPVVLYAAYVVLRRPRPPGVSLRARPRRPAECAAAALGSDRDRDLRDLAARPRDVSRGAPMRTSSAAAAGWRWSSAGQLAQFGQWAARPDLQELPGVGRARDGAAARHARPRQAGQRAVAREPDPADLRRHASSATTPTGSSATMCGIF